MHILRNRSINSIEFQIIFFIFTALITWNPASSGSPFKLLWEAVYDIVPNLNFVCVDFLRENTFTWCPHTNWETGTFLKSHRRRDLYAWRCVDIAHWTRNLPPAFHSLGAVTCLVECILWGCAVLPFGQHATGMRLFTLSCCKSVQLILNRKKSIFYFAINCGQAFIVHKGTRILFNPDGISRNQLVRYSYFVFLNMHHNRTMK
jgi:hypothetical protein